MDFSGIKPISKTPLFLITGFLGSGKTTFLKRILEKYAGSKKIAIVQNEFAPANVDGQDLKTTGKAFEILEVNKGSVFCVCLLSGFIPSLQKFVEECQPDAVFLEASGLADPIAIAEMMGAPELNDLYLAGVWCIVDALNFGKVGKFSTRLHHQVGIADVVLINKTDLNPDTGDIQKEINELNPYGEILEATFSDIPLDNLFKGSNELASMRQKVGTKTESPGRPDINSSVLRTASKISMEKLQNFLDTYGSKTARMKGYVRLDDDQVMAVQSCFGKSEMTLVNNYHASTELIAMGEDITPREMKEAFVR